jgi:hypothetical protein
MIDGDLATNTYALGPVEVFSKRSQIVRETLAYAADNGGRGQYGHLVTMPLKYDLAKLLADKLAEQESPEEVREVSEEYTRYYTYRYQSEPVLEARTAHRVFIYDAESWRVLAERADKITLDNASGVRDGLAVFYKDGKPFGLLMPIKGAPEKFKEA